MEKEHDGSETDEVTPWPTEDAMKATIQSVTVPPVRRTTSPNLCTHSRAIDEVLTRAKKRSGKVRCLECGATFDDPYQGSK